MAHALILEGADPEAAADADILFERAGHETRSKFDEVYRRATWGRRPEDAAALRALTADVSGRR